ncbi:hypothetical protein LZ32DRAFT_676155 [Colletotrichum eremochloae]|nr:hypothetical protein LZ32DRAFT_676155 [Colletotrichum eremochloae]
MALLNRCLTLSRLPEVNPDAMEWVQYKELSWFPEIIFDKFPELQMESSQQAHSETNEKSLSALQKDSLLEKSTARATTQSPVSSPQIQNVPDDSDALSHSAGVKLLAFSPMGLTTSPGGDKFIDDVDDISMLGSPDMRATDSGNEFAYGEVDELPPRPLSSFSKQDAPFTDSGYASTIKVDDLQQMGLEHADTLSYDKKDVDSKTVYSGASTVAIDQAQRYITELSNIIHGRISGNTNFDDWRSLSERLSAIIKDFAIKLGLESSIQINRDIMYFVHKRSHEIAEKLNSLVLSVDAPTEDADESEKTNRDHMPLNDKMAMWISKATDMETSVNASELFVGVEDVEEAIDAPELSKYNKTITESHSFKWLIENLRRELALKRDNDESTDHNHREILRSKIMGCLPSGGISKARPPTTHYAAFRLPGWPLLDRANSDRCESEKLLDEAIVVTCCSGNAQAVSIVGYMEQTWPSTWEKILNLLQAVTRSAGGDVYTDTLHDKTQVSTFYEHGSLIMSLEGPAHTIAECGEQLAWLRAAYVHTSSHHAVGSIVQHIPAIVNTAELRRRSREAVTSLSNAKEHSWTQLPKMTL